TLKIYDRERDKGVAQHRPPKGKERDWYLQFIKDKALVDVEVKRGGATFTSFVPIKQSVPYLATNSLDLEGASHRGQFHASVVGSDIIALTLKPLP
ncbi:MAG: hypothetical protein NT023_25735, partial [Armatimonadetes bacterium]|nr:hypothetical protein [Armatimonadota bacterium]